MIFHISTHTQHGTEGRRDGSKIKTFDFKEGRERDVLTLKFVTLNVFIIGEVLRRQERL
jgi:hypothetical protein